MIIDDHRCIIPRAPTTSILLRWFGMVWVGGSNYCTYTVPADSEGSEKFTSLSLFTSFTVLIASCS